MTKKGLDRLSLLASALAYIAEWKGQNRRAHLVETRTGVIVHANTIFKELKGQPNLGHSLKRRLMFTTMSANADRGIGGIISDVNPRGWQGISTAKDRKMLNYKLEHESTEEDQTPPPTPHTEHLNSEKRASGC